jgi:hypothetical protein
MKRTNALQLWRAALIGLGVVTLLGGSAAHAQRIVRDSYIRIQVDDASGRFTIQNLDGDPLNVNDDNLNALFSDVTAAVKTTLYVNSLTVPVSGAETGIFGDTGSGRILQIPSVAPDGRSITAAWGFPTAVPDAEGRDIRVQQKISLVRDLARIEYTIVNAGQAKVVGLRLAVDPSASTVLDPTLFEAPPGSTNHDDTSNPFFVPKQGFFGFETDFRPAFPTGIPRNLITTPIPSEWYTFSPAFNPFAFWKGALTTLPDATPPDRVVFAGYDPLVDGSGPSVDPLLPDWSYTTNPNQSITGPETVNGDASVAVFWGPRSLGAGQRLTLVTYISVGVASHGLSGRNLQNRPDNNPAFVAAAESPFSDALVSGVASDFQFFGFAMNLLNTVSVPGATATINLPDGLELAPPTLDPVVPLGDLDPFTPGNPNVERQTSWTLHPNGVAAGVLPVNLTVTSPLGSASVRREISVPQGTLYRIRQEFGMFTFPFTFTNSAPDAVLGLASSDFQIIRWNPDANGGAGAYEPALAIRAGESYWIRLLGVLPFVDVTINGATPINIPGSGFGPGGSFATAIRPNWNMVGNPSPYAVLAKDLRIQDPSTGEVVNLSDSVARRFLLGSLWRFDRNLGTYVQVSATDYIQPGEGIWIFAARPLVMLWPAPLGFQISVS